MTPSPDPLKAWVQHHRSAFDQLEPRADLWAAIEADLPALQPEASPADELHSFVEKHRPAFDVLEPRADLWAAIEEKLTPTAPQAVPMHASRGGTPQAASRPSWWQLAAAAVVVFGLGYSLRMTTEAPQSAMPAVAVIDAPEPPVLTDGSAVMPTHGFVSTPNWRTEPDPAVNATLLTHDMTSAEPLTATTATDHPRPEQIAPEIARLEARYEALLAKRRAELRHFGPARPLADEWDREMSVLDSTYAELRRELTRNPNTDDVVEAMTRNLHLRMELLDQQARTLEAVRQARHRAERLRPNRPPSVNPDANGTGDEPAGWISPPARPTTPTLPDPGRTGGASATVKRVVVAA